MNRIVPALLGLLLMVSGSIAAQNASVRLVNPPPTGIRLIEGWRPVSATSDTRIIGTVIDVHRVPVAEARVQVRNLTTALITQVHHTDENGNYEFLVDPGTYVVEMARSDGHVLALSNAGSLARYETLRTIIQLPGRWDPARSEMFMMQNIASFLGMSAANSMTATTLSLAAEESLSKVEPGEPVSPQ